MTSGIGGKEPPLTAIAMHEPGSFLSNYLDRRQNLDLSTFGPPSDFTEKQRRAPPAKTTCVCSSSA